MTAREAIERADTALGIEFGSTRIKAVLVDRCHRILGVGGADWENEFVDGIWTYDMADVVGGLQAVFASLVADVRQRHGVGITTVGMLGVSAMMHGYLALGEDGQPLVGFRTWRNTMTKSASQELSELFEVNIPQRWSIAHLRQAILDDEPHVPDVRRLTTLAGYVHTLLTGEHVLGVGDASGMFPLDYRSRSFDRRAITLFDELNVPRGHRWNLESLLPDVLGAGDSGGVLTEQGALLIDPTGELRPGIRLCPPESDAGTGMVATNSVRVGTGNVSVGTSVFAMIVLSRALGNVGPELDPVATPDGAPVAMAHNNNGTSDINQWVALFGEFSELVGAGIATDDLFKILFQHAMTGAPDAGRLMSYNYLSGEHVTRCDVGRPLFVRVPDSDFSLANFMRTHLMSAFASLRIGMDILMSQEGVTLRDINAHGGMFRTPGAAQEVLAAALDTPVTVQETADEGGAYGMALLANYARLDGGATPLADYLEQKVFAGVGKVTVEPDPRNVAGFAAFMERYRAGLPLERAAGGVL